MNVKLIESEDSLLQDLSPPPPQPSSIRPSSTILALLLSPEASKADHDTIQILDEHYDLGLEENYVFCCAKEAYFFHNALVSIVAFILFISLGATVFSHTSNFTLVESILFTMVTWTTTGYDNHLNRSPFVMAFLIFYLLVGIATLTVFVTQIYLYLAYIASSDYTRKNEYLFRISQPTTTTTTTSTTNVQDDERNIGGDDDSVYTPYQMLDKTKHGNKNYPPLTNSGGSSSSSSEGKRNYYYRPSSITSRVTVPLYIALSNSRNKYVKWILKFFQDDPMGQLIIYLIPCFLLLLFSGTVFTITEGWTYLEGVYFSTVSLTTCGYGDFTPSKLTSKWFCIFWLPLSIPFMIWYTSGVSKCFTDYDDMNIEKYKPRIRNKLRTMKQKKYNTTSGSSSHSPSSQIHSRVPDGNMVELTLQKESLLGNHHHHDLALTVEHGLLLSSSSSTTTNTTMDPLNTTTTTTSSSTTVDNMTLMQQRPESMKRMKHVLDAVRLTLAKTTATIFPDHATSRNQKNSSHPSPVAQYFSLRAAKQISAEEAGKPSFILRALVLERLGNIIVNEVAGSETTTEYNNTSITITFHKLNAVAIKWMIPNSARKSFYSVCTQCLFFVGMHTLEVRKAEALFDLTSYDFFVLLGPFLSDMGSSEDMENWLKATNILAKEIFIGVDLEEAIRRRQRRTSAISITSGTLV